MIPKITKKNDRMVSTHRKTRVVIGIIIVIVFVTALRLIASNSNDEKPRFAVAKGPKVDLVPEKKILTPKQTVVQKKSEDKANEKTPQGLVEVDSPADNEFDGPLKELVPTEAQTRLLYEAEEEIVATCMDQRGFEYIPNPYISNDKNRDPIKPGDASAAQARGYGIGESMEKEGDFVPETAAPNQALLEHLSSDEQKAWTEAFSGQIDMKNPSGSVSVVSLEVPDLGKVSWDTRSCLATARSTLYGDDVRHMENRILEDKIREEFTETVDQDPEYQNAIKNWQDCMSNQGLSYEYPGQAAGLLRRDYAQGKLDLDDLKRRELAIAPIEATCYRQCAMGQTLAAAENRAEAQIRVQYGNDIDALHQFLQGALVQAEQFANAR